MESGFNFGGSSFGSNTGVSFVGKANNWGTEEDAKAVVVAIEKCKVLEYLNLEGNTLGVGAANAIAKALEKHPEFKRALWKDLFTGRLKTEIPQALESMGKGMITAGAQLVVLDCSDNALGPNGMRGLVDLLKSPTCYSLKELKLNNCGLGIEGGRMLANSLTECFVASSLVGMPFQLKVFIAGRNRLENDGAKALAAIFGKIGSLEEIAMPQNGINHDGIRALSEAFRTNTDLKVLNLNDNTITPKGAVDLAESFEFLKNLVEINLGDCLLKSGGALQLGEALLDGHEYLKILNLGFNEIGPSGGLSIASAMQNKPNIESIILNGNMFGQECRDTISQMLAEYQKLDALGELDEDDSDNECADEEGDDDDEDYDDEHDDYGESDTEDAGDDDYASTTENLTLNDFNQSLNKSSFNSGLWGVAAPVPAPVVEEPQTVETFCETPNPTAALFRALSDSDKVAAFRDYLSAKDEADYLVYVAFAILKCSAISNVCPDALIVSDALYKDCFDFARNTSQMNRVKNFFLTQLGLLLNEDKTFKPAYDTGACRSAVQHAIKVNQLPGEVSSMFQLFLERFQ